MQICAPSNNPGLDFLLIMLLNMYVVLIHSAFSALMLQCRIKTLEALSH